MGLFLYIMKSIIADIVPINNTSKSMNNDP